VIIIATMADAQKCDDSIMHKLTIEQKEYAAKVLNESDENKEIAIPEIKRWIQENDLRARTDDFFILRFLRACKFNIEKTKTRMRNYQKQRVNLPVWFANRDPLQPKVQELLDLGICLPLRKLDSEGRMVCLVRFIYDPDVFTFSEVIKVINMVFEVAIRDSIEISLYGIVVIADFEHTTWRHISQMKNPSIIMNAVHAWQGCYPIRIRLINLINMPEYAKLFVAIVRYFLSNKLKERMHIYSRNIAHECFKDMPTNILPVEYGGSDGTIQELTEYWKEVMEENREWLINDEKYKPISKK